MRQQDWGRIARNLPSYPRTDTSASDTAQDVADSRARDLKAGGGELDWDQIARSVPSYPDPKGQSDV